MRRIALIGLLVSGCIADEGHDRGSSGIVNGHDETGYEAVGSIRVGAGQCTATLVAPRVVISAKHCLLPTTLPGDLRFSTGFDAEVPAGVGERLFYPGERRGHVYQPEDIFAVVLDRAPSVAPMPFRRAKMTGDLEGDLVTLVGFGVTAAGADDSGTRRSGEATINDVNRKDFLTRRADGQATNCDGDSGGPVVLAGEVAGIVIGSVNGNCMTYGIHTRVDRYTATIDEAIRWADENPPSAPPAPSPASGDEPADDDPPTPDVEPNRYEECPEGYCVGGDAFCDEDLECCSSDTDCETEPVDEPEPEAACDCDTTWGCDECWCEPATECEDAGVDEPCDCDLTWQCDDCWCEPADECA